MKRIFRSVLASALIAAMILSSALVAFGAESQKVNVQFNGKDFTLWGSSEQPSSGTAMVPFRQLFEAIGGKVTYDKESGVISAVLSGKAVSLKAGEKQITVTENGKSSAKKIETAPVIGADHSVYIPVRDVAEGLGYCVGWDTAAKTIVIIDPAKIFADADKDFSIISLLMQTSLDKEKAYSTSGTFDMDVKTAANPSAMVPDLNFSVSGSLSGIQQKSSADIAMSLAFHFDKMLESLTQEQKLMVVPLLDAYKNMDLKMKINGETGITYMNSSLLSKLSGMGDSNTWYKVDAYAPYEEMGIDMKALNNMSYSDIDIAKLLQTSLKNTNYINADTYQEVKTTYDFFRYLIGNDAFETNRDKGTNTHSLSIDRDAVSKALVKAAFANGISTADPQLTEMGDALKNADFNIDIVINDIGGNFSGYYFGGSAAAEGMDLSFHMYGNMTDASSQITIEQKNLMTMVMNLQSHMAESKELPNLELPAGAKVVEIPQYPAY